MRHHLVHGYFDIDPDVVWVAISERVPELKRDIEQILATDNAVQDDGKHQPAVTERFTTM